MLEKGPNDHMKPQKWKEINDSAEFKKLMAEKKRFLSIAIVFSFLYYFSLPLSVGYFPEIMNTKLVGSMNLAYFFALSQFFVAWGIAYLYKITAAKWDQQVEIIKRNAREV